MLSLLGPYLALRSTGHRIVQHDDAIRRSRAPWILSGIRGDALGSWRDGAWDLLGELIVSPSCLGLPHRPLHTRAARAFTNARLRRERQPAEGVLFSAVLSHHADRRAPLRHHRETGCL